jgi:hypothetical protein
MLPSSTVENYLKAIFLGTAGVREGERPALLPMGQLATRPTGTRSCWPC